MKPEREIERNIKVIWKWQNGWWKNVPPSSEYLLVYNGNAQCIQWKKPSTKPRDWLGRTSPKWSAFCRVRCKTLTQSMECKKQAKYKNPCRLPKRKKNTAILTLPISEATVSCRSGKHPFHKPYGSHKVLRWFPYSTLWVSHFLGRT